MLEYLHGLGITDGEASARNGRSGVLGLLGNEVEPVAIDGSVLVGASQLHTGILLLHHAINPLSVVGEEIDGGVLVAIPVLVDEEYALGVVHRSSFFIDHLTCSAMRGAAIVDDGSLHVTLGEGDAFYCRIGGQMLVGGTSLHNLILSIHQSK